MRRTDPIERGVGDRDRAPARNEDEEPLQDRRHGQGHDQRRQTEIADDEAVQRSDSGGDEKRERDCSEPGGVGVESHQRQDDGGDRDDRADREIDPAADHGNGLADTNEADHRRKLDDIAQVGVGAEARDQERGRDPQDRDNPVGDERAAVRGRKALQAQDRVQDALRKDARIKGSATVATMISPWTTYCATKGRPMKNMTLIRMLMSRLPASAPRMAPCPPRNPPPPSTAAAMAESVSGSPIKGSPEPVCAAT